MHVDDIVRGSLELSRLGVIGPVNFCTGRPVSMTDLAEMAAEQVGYEPSIAVLNRNPGVAYRVGDPTALNHYYRPRITLEEGIAQCLAASSSRHATDRGTSPS